MRALALLLALATAAADAQPRELALDAELTSLSGAYADGRSAGGRLFLPYDGGWVRLDGSYEDRFGDRALVYGFGAARELTDRWLLIGGAGSSTSGLVHPRIQGHLGVARRWGAERRLLTTAQVAMRDARDEHFDTDASLEAALYADAALVQLGGRLSVSQPGDAVGGGVWGAVTLGDPAGRRFTGRLAANREAYLLTGADPLDVRFRSVEGWAEWHEPVGATWSASVRVGLYANPYYTRAGVRTGLVRRF